MNATFTTSGPHSITAKYSGDSNYAGVTSSASSINVYYPTVASESASSTTINLGQSVTITATVTSSYKSPAMTGTFQFLSNYSPIGGSVTTVLSTDGAGNQILTATLTTAPTTSASIEAYYSGDSNFQPSNAQININVNIPDFSLNVPANPLVINAGEHGTLSIAVAPASGMASAVAISCGGSLFHGFCMQRVTVNRESQQQRKRFFCISVTPSVAGAGTAARRAIAAQHFQQFPLGPAGLVGLGLFAGLASLAMYIAPRRSSHWRIATRGVTVCVISLVLGCSGGGSSGGSGNGGGGGTQPTAQPTAQPTVTTLTTSAAKVAQYSQLILTATVSGTGTPTGAVSFYMSGAYVGQAFMVGNTASVTTNSTYNPGIYSLTAQYSGDSLNNPSTSATVSEAVTGSTTAYVQGQTSTIVHLANVTITIQ